MTKTQRIENLTNNDYIKPKWQRNAERRMAGRARREQETRDAQEERNKKIGAMKRKWIRKLKEHEGLYSKHGRQLELFMKNGEQPTRHDDWVSGWNVGVSEILEELVKDLSEV